MRNTPSLQPCPCRDAHRVAHKMADKMAGEDVFEAYHSYGDAQKIRPVAIDAYPSLEHAVASGDPKIVRQVLPKFTAQIPQASVFEANLCAAWNRDLDYLHRSYILRFAVALCTAE